MTDLNNNLKIEKMKLPSHIHANSKKIPPSNKLLFSRVNLPSLRPDGEGNERLLINPDKE